MTKGKKRFLWFVLIAVGLSIIGHLTSKDYEKYSIDQASGVATVENYTESILTAGIYADDICKEISQFMNYKVLNPNKDEFKNIKLVRFIFKTTLKDYYGHKSIGDTAVIDVYPEEWSRYSEEYRTWPHDNVYRMVYNSRKDMNFQLRDAFQDKISE